MFAQLYGADAVYVGCCTLTFRQRYHLYRVTFSSTVPHVLFHCWFSFAPWCTTRCGAADLETYLIQQPKYTAVKYNEFQHQPRTALVDSTFFSDFLRFPCLGIKCEKGWIWTGSVTRSFEHSTGVPPDVETKMSFRLDASKITRCSIFRLYAPVV